MYLGGTSSSLRGGALFLAFFLFLSFFLSFFSYFLFFFFLNFFFYFFFAMVSFFPQGGGWCFDEDSCLSRSNSPIGSSAHWGTTTNCCLLLLSFISLSLFLYSFSFYFQADTFHLSSYYFFLMQMGSVMVSSAATRLPIPTFTPGTLCLSATATAGRSLEGKR